MARKLGEPVEYPFVQGLPDFPIITPIGGMRTSLTNDVTIFPNAPPMTMPTAADERAESTNTL